MSEPAIVDAVLDTRPPRRLRFAGWAAVVAVLVHGALSMLALRGPSLESWAAALAIQVHQELIRLEVVDVAPVPPPPEEHETRPPAEAEQPAVPPPPARAESRAPRSRDSPPAAAGRILADEPREPLDLTKDVFVTGRARGFAGGVTTADGTSRRPGGSGRALPAAAQQPAPPPARAGAEISRSRERPPVPEGGDWECPWPVAADTLEIDQAEVIVRARVDARGRVLAVFVVEDPGFGFADAAVQCVRTESFSPGLDRQGRPAAGQSPPIRIRFTR